MIYGYAAVPNASTAASRLLSSRGEKLEYTPSQYFFLNNEVNYKLGHPGVSFFLSYYSISSEIIEKRIKKMILAFE
jgi:hypothetical protein